MHFPVSATLNSVFRLFFISILFASSLLATNHAIDFPTQRHCIHHHFSALLSLKLGFHFSNDSIAALPSWNPSNTNCCSWEGITCNDTTGHVIGLDLSNSHVSGRIDFQILFSIRSLQRLSLAGTSFHPSPIPSGFDQLTGLTQLNLSQSPSFYGQIPLAISSLTGLVSLDLSYSDFVLENPNLQILVQNLSSLEELYLDGVAVGMSGSEWGQALSSALPNLKKLSLRKCNLSGSIPSSLSKLHSLSQLDLSHNVLSSTLPRFIGNFSSLTSLNLTGCELYGELPDSVGNLKLLTILDLSGNEFKGTLPSSLLSLPLLRRLDLPFNEFNGQLGEFLNASSSPLEFIDLTWNNFQGPIPMSIFHLRRLTSLTVSGNNFSGAVDLGLLKNLTKLQNLDLSHNSLSGNSTSVFADNPSLQTVDLGVNHFGGQLFELYNASTSLLKRIHLYVNDFQGPIPRWIFQLPHLTDLDLSANNFSGVVDLSLLKNLKQLQSLDLSYNSFSINNEGSNSSFFSFPQLSSLSLSSCNISEFPDMLRNQEWLEFLDLSMNRISGNIPRWVWNVGNGGLKLLDLHQNALEGFEKPLPHPSLNSLVYIDLSDNMLQGSLPPLIFKVTSLQFIDLSNNSFSGSLNQTFRKGSRLKWLHLNRNQLEGPLPRSLAHCRKLKVLRLEENKVTDTFPFWLQNLPELSVFILRSNKFYGRIGPETSNSTFSRLEVFDISSNSFVGSLPPNAFKSWTAMMAGHESPFSIGNVLSELGRQNGETMRLVIKKIELKYENIPDGFAFIDLSNNRFEGYIPESLGDLKLLRSLNMSHNNLTGRIPASIGNLTNLESLDLSQNDLIGEIPEQLADVASLAVLNLSYNSLVGSIPQGRQFDTFNNDSFLGNPGLCGTQISRKCGEAKAPPTAQQPGDDDEFDWRIIWIAFGVGYGVGWGVLYWTLALWRDGRRRKKHEPRDEVQGNLS